MCSHNPLEASLKCKKNGLSLNMTFSKHSSSYSTPLTHGGCSLCSLVLLPCKENLVIQTATSSWSRYIFKSPANLPIKCLMLREENLEPCYLANWSGEKQLSLIIFFVCGRPLPMCLPSSHPQLRETWQFTLEKTKRTYPALWISAYPTTSTGTFLLAWSMS